MAVSWPSLLRVTVVVLLIAAIITALYTLPVEKVLKDFLVWIKQNLGPWGPLVLAISYIPLTVLAVPASILTLGGGYLFGLPVGFVADSIGATIGATAAFMLGRTIVLLLRLVPLLPFNMLNYLLSITPIGVGEYMMASWLGMMPITLALVYVGTTLKDLADVTHGWNEVSTSRWIFIICGFVVSAILMVCITKVAKSSLEKALAENTEGKGTPVSPQLPIVSGPPLDLHQPLVIRIDASSDDHEK